MTIQILLQLTWLRTYSTKKQKKNTSFKGKTNNSTNKALESACWECGKPGHQNKNCFVFKNKKKKAMGVQASTSKDPLVLNRLGYKLVFEADRYIICKNNLYLGHAYLSNSLFMLYLNLNKITRTPFKVLNKNPKF